MRSSFGLALTLLVCAASVLKAQPAEFLGSYNWTSPEPEFGGLSALEVTVNGREVIALSDRGFLVFGTIVREGEDAKIQSIQTERLVPLVDKDGQGFEEFDRDSEGLAIAPDGGLYISFEAIHGVRKFDRSGRMVSEGVMRHPDFLSMQRNSSLEPLAIDGDGRLCTAPERSGRLLRPFPVYCRDQNGWSQPFAIPRSDDYLLAGMDFGPDGRLYVLERALRSIFFASRVRSFEVEGNTLGDERVVLETPGGRHDNLEGISVWRSDDGHIRISLVSDDNFNLFQRTEIVEYRVP